MPHEDFQWNWQQADWPKFSYDDAAMRPLEHAFLHSSGMLRGIYHGFGDEGRAQLKVELMSEEAVTSSAIEGELLDRSSVQSSIRSFLGLNDSHQPVVGAETRIAHMLVAMQQNVCEPLTHRDLWQWHHSLFEGTEGIDAIGCYRWHQEPMQIVSGRLDRPSVHFEAPPADQVRLEMDRFLKWFNSTDPQAGSSAMSTLARTAISHLYFESIHPFEDGNGRLGRALAEKVLGQAIGGPALLSLSGQLKAQRSEYYRQLELASRSNHVHDWVCFFAEMIVAAQEHALGHASFAIQKIKFLDRHADGLNIRQEKALDRLFRAEPDGFEGGLSASNYIRITGTSRATATRDLAELVAMGALTRSGDGKGTRYQLAL